MTQPGWLKPLRHPRAWLALWWLAVVLVFVVCLVPAPDLPPVPRGFDKVEHFLAFFLLAASAVQLYATRRALWCAALGLVGLGVVIELAQFAFTSSRSMDPRDVLADTLGIAAGFAIALTPLRDLLLRMEARLSPR
ncbi:MAG TPA: VanZ family protein [Luteimonas sp.]|nr:VanZ family protein [Luteimonas sp.]